MKQKKKQVIGWMVLAIVWMIFIYSQSATPYQKQDIKPFLKEYISLHQPSRIQIEFYYDDDLVSNEDPYEWIEFWIRKGGHVGEYAILAFFVMMSIRSTTFKQPIKFLLIFLIPFLYACSDEWHQSLVPNRTGHIIDVVTFDLLGILLVLVFFAVMNRWKMKRSGR